MQNQKSKIKNQKYDPTNIEPKWQKKWEEAGIYSPDLDQAEKPFLDRRSQNFRGKFYNLMMFPYPSAEGMHVGNMYAFTGSDIYGRFKRMQGHDVFEPIGLDGFGIHSENYAIKVGRHPKEQAKISQKNFYRQLRATGNAFDWSRTVQTYDPDYYKWTQWIFIQLFKKGLAYRKKSPVNFCPSCKTVLSDEQVIDGKCERCSSIVEKRELEQWFFKITKYADRLLNGLSQIDWTEKVKIAQRQWIGKREGTIIKFQVASQGNTSEVAQRDSSDGEGISEQYIEVFTVFPETIYGVTYMVLAPENPLASKLATKEQQGKVNKYIQDTKNKTEVERAAQDKAKTGVFTGSYCINPVNNQKVPIWVADYVLAGYGTGAVMGVPGSDHRDFVFAQKYKLPITRVIGKTKDDLSMVDSEKEVLEEGILVNSQQFSGLTTPNPAREKIKDFLEEKGFGKRKNQYHLRDWLISRQRYWGPPIPMIFCQTCAKNDISYSSRVILGRSKATTPESDSGQARMTDNMMGWFPVPEKDLPVLLPDVKDWKPEGTGKSPLASVASFVNTKCPNCGGEAVRETDVSDTFLDSSWYFLRYLATDYNNVPFSSKAFSNVIARSEATWQSEKDRHALVSARARDDISRRARWLPVNMYIGGAEHSVLHLLYVRFITMVLHDLGLIDFDEPFPRFFAHGLLIKEGGKMSKSKGNVVVPDAYIKKYGADTLRTYLMFLGPFSQGGDFYDSSISGVYRFLGRVWRLFHDVIARSEGARDNDVNKKLHQTIKKVSEDMENLRFNTAIAALMELLNTFYLYQNQLNRTHLGQFILLLAPFAPHVSEELWQALLNSKVKTQKSKLKYKSIHQELWPTYEPKLLEEEEVTIVVSVNGKMRDTIKVSSFKLQDSSFVENTAKESEKVKKYTGGKNIKKVIYVPGKIINFVVD